MLPRDLQDEADKRNRAAAEAGLTDRWCACRSLAIVAIGRERPDPRNPEGVSMWMCHDCFSDWIRRKGH